MDRDDEIFELVDADDAVLGTAPRSEVHCRGLLHRAVYCWVFNAAGEVLLQRRSPKKRIGGGLWDLSLAEHLQPGESWEEVRRAVSPAHPPTCPPPRPCAPHPRSPAPRRPWCEV
jgi:isopentenyldiphosphate isomerase